MPNRSHLRTAIGGTGLALLLLARATSAEAAGPTPAARFAATAQTRSHTTPAALDTVVACFKAGASLPSFAHTAHYPGAAVIRLRFDGHVFETLEFAATPGGGTRITVALSGNYDAGDRARYTAARGTPLAACLTPSPVRIAANTPDPAL